MYRSFFKCFAQYFFLLVFTCVFQYASGQSVDDRKGANVRRWNPGGSVLREVANADVAEGDRAVVPLQHDRPGLIKISIQLTTGRARYHHVIVNHDAVELHGDAIAHHLRLDALPFSGRTRHELARGLVVVYRSVSAQLRTRGS